VRRQSEHGLQIAVAHMLELVVDPGECWWTAVDHGVGRLGKAEAGIRKRRGVKAGIPDFIFLCMNPFTGPWLFGVELKAGKGSLSAAQKDLRDAWQRMGVPIDVARSLEDVQGILEHRNVALRRRMNLFSKGKAA
jgi:hypothetical protein